MIWDWRFWGLYGIFFPVYYKIKTHEMMIWLWKLLFMRNDTSFMIRIFGNIQPW